MRTFILWTFPLVILGGAAQTAMAQLEPSPGTEPQRPALCGPVLSTPPLIKKIKMPVSYGETLGLESVTGGGKETAIDFRNTDIEFSDGRVIPFGELLGTPGQTAATFTSRDQADKGWAVRVTTKIDMLEWYIKGNIEARAQGFRVPQIRQVKKDGRLVLDALIGNYVWVELLDPKPLAPAKNPNSFATANAEYLYANWDALDPKIRAEAHKELVSFLIRAAHLSYYFDFTPQNVVRSTKGWVLIDPTVGIDESVFIEANEKTRTQTVINNQENNCENKWQHMIEGVTKQTLSENAQEMLLNLHEEILKQRNLRPN